MKGLETLSEYLCALDWWLKALTRYEGFGNDVMRRNALAVGLLLKALTRYEGFGNGAGRFLFLICRHHVEGTDPL